MANHRSKSFKPNAARGCFCEGESKQQIRPQKLDFSTLIIPVRLTENSFYNKTKVGKIRLFAYCEFIHILG